MKTVTLRLGDLTFSDVCERIPSADIALAAYAEQKRISERARKIEGYSRQQAVAAKTPQAKREAMQPGREARQIANEAYDAVTVFEAGGNLFGRTRPMVVVV